MLVQELRRGRHGGTDELLDVVVDVLAWNRLAAALLVDFGALPPGQRNTALLVFLDEGMRSKYPAWEQAARETVAHLRLLAGRTPTTRRSWS